MSNERKVSQTVKTNVARLFLRLLDKHFPGSHILRKLFNRNTIKVSFSCMGNVAYIIKKHNQQKFPLAKKSESHRVIAKIGTNSNERKVSSAKCSS